MDEYQTCQEHDFVKVFSKICVSVCTCYSQISPHGQNLLPLLSLWGNVGLFFFCPHEETGFKIIQNFFENLKWQNILCEG